MNNEVSNISAYVVVDCRYPYEYEGGHVQVCLSYLRSHYISLEFNPVHLRFTHFC